MKIEIIRGIGDKQASPLIDVLTTTEQAGYQKGRNYLDNHGWNKINYSISSKYAVIPELGSIIKVMDSQLGKSFMGKITGWSLKVSGLTKSNPITIISNLTIERSVV